MLLIRNTEIAKNDVHCYKVLIVKDDDLCSPYKQYNKWIINELTEDKRPIIKNKKRAGYKVITKGFFHTYSNLSRAKHFLERYTKKNKQYKVFIYKAIIPANSRYYSDNCGQYCSKFLKILDRCVQYLN